MQKTYANTVIKIIIILALVSLGWFVGYLKGVNTGKKTNLAAQNQNAKNLEEQNSNMPPVPPLIETNTVNQNQPTQENQNLPKVPPLIK